MHHIIIERTIPYLEGLAETVAHVSYLDSKDFSPKTIAGADALIVRSITPCDQALLEGSQVAFVATATAGFDHIDTNYCASHGIGWSNAPGCNADGVVQYVLSSLSSWSLSNRVSLRGLKIGIIGVGNVGGRLARKAGALGLVPLCYDPPRAEVEGPEGFVSLEYLQRESDIISLHVPLTKSGRYATLGMVDDSFVKACERKPILINACRGGVTKSEALCRGLKEGYLRELIIDCWEGEPHIHQDLLSLAYVGTPHIAGFSADGKFRGSRMALEAVLRHFGLSVPNLWNDTCLISPQVPIIDLSLYTGDEQIYRAQLHTFDPIPTSRSLHDAPDHFEAQRKSYTYPREMEAYSVIGAEAQVEDSLRKLGFQIIHPGDTRAYEE